MTKHPLFTELTVPGGLSVASFGPWSKNVTGIVTLWMARSRQRRHLAALDDDALLDLGLSHQDVRREVNKPFWQA